MNELIQHLARNGSGFIATDYFARVVWPDDFAAGHRLMIDAILAGDDPAMVLVLTRSADAIRGSADQSTGAVAAIMDCLDALDRGGKRLQVAPVAEYGLAQRALESSGEMRRAVLRATPPDYYGTMLGLLCQAARAAGPHLARSEPAAPPAPPPPTPVQVNVALELPVGPVPMTIVGQPATRSVQTVRRDEHDEIVETVTETRPLPAAA